jgi:hypothetical protein
MCTYSVHTTNGMCTQQTACAHNKRYVHRTNGMCTQQAVCAHKLYVHTTSGMCTQQAVCAHKRYVRTTNGMCTQQTVCAHIALSIHVNLGNLLLLYTAFPALPNYILIPPISTIRFN